MRLSLVETPRKICTVPRSLRIHLRAISGTALLARDPQTLFDGGGLPVGTADGIVSLEWENGALWMAGQGGAAVVEAIVPE